MSGTSNLYVLNKDNKSQYSKTFHCKNLSLCTYNSIHVLTYLENTGELCSRYGLALGICRHSDHQVSALSQFHRTIYWCLHLQPLSHPPLRHPKFLCPRQHWMKNLQIPSITMNGKVQNTYYVCFLVSNISKNWRFEYDIFQIVFLNFQVNSKYMLIREFFSINQYVKFKLFYKIIWERTSDCLNHIFKQQYHIPIYSYCIFIE